MRSGPAPFSRTVDVFGLMVCDWFPSHPSRGWRGSRASGTRCSSAGGTTAPFTRGGSRYRSTATGRCCSSRRRGGCWWTRRAGPGRLGVARDRACRRSHRFIRAPRPRLRLRARRSHRVIPEPRRRTRIPSCRTGLPSIATQLSRGKSRLRPGRPWRSQGTAHPGENPPYRDRRQREPSRASRRLSRWIPGCPGHRLQGIGWEHSSPRCDTCIAAPIDAQATVPPPETEPH